MWAVGAVLDELLDLIAAARVPALGTASQIKATPCNLLHSLRFLIPALMKLLVSMTSLFGYSLGPRSLFRVVLDPGAFALLTLALRPFPNEIS
jgi:hypothetical protein